MQAPQTEFDDAQWICIKKIKGRYTHDVIAFIPVCVGGRPDRRPLPQVLPYPWAKPVFWYGTFNEGSINLSRSILAACVGPEAAEALQGAFLIDFVGCKKAPYWKIKVGDVRSWYLDMIGVPIEERQTWRSESERKPRSEAAV